MTFQKREIVLLVEQHSYLAIKSTYIVKEDALIKESAHLLF
jgi:hypothetical protein